MGKERRSGSGVPRAAVDGLDLRDDRVVVGADALEQAAHDGREHECDCRDGNCGEDGPEQEGVPLP